MAYNEKTSRNSSSSMVEEWIQERFRKRECVRVVPVSKDSIKCGCGRNLALHYYYEGEEESAGWDVHPCTAAFPTDAYGTLTFRSGKGFRKARYIRTDFDTDPADLWSLLVEVWGFEPPTLVITIQDAGQDQPELAHCLTKAIRKGLSKAARTGSTWIITSGLKTGTNEAITAFGDASSWRNNKSQCVQVIGFAPWGLVRGTDQLLGVSSNNVRYCGLQEATDHSNDKPVSGRLLGEGHSGFVLVDDGTLGRPSTSAEIVRRRFEDFLRYNALNKGKSKVLVVSLMVNGKQPSLEAFFDYVTRDPPVPVVALAKTGGVADWISVYHEMISKSESPRPSTMQRRISRHIQAYLEVEKDEANRVAHQLRTVVESSANSITVYKAFDRVCDDRETQELDVAILNGLLKGLPLSSSEKLNLTVAWGRVDLAKEILDQIGNAGTGRTDDALEEAMMGALMYDKVDFVNLLLCHGVAMDRFLTIARLEKLYNSKNGPSNTLEPILQDLVKNASPNYKYKLPHIGLVVEKLMGNGYRSGYCRKEFRKRHKLEMLMAQRSRSIPSAAVEQSILVSRGHRSSIFSGPRHRPYLVYPYHELFVWAVLTNRKQLAMQFWGQGQEQLAKALLGSRLYASLAKEAEEDYLEMEVCQQLQKNAQEFKTLACELLAQCYETDDDLTLQLLTYELRQFSRSTCISLAVAAENQAFMAHQSCQLLLADLWLGGLRLRKNANVKVLASVLCPPLIATLTFKTKEELQLQAQTAEESVTYRDTGDRKKSWAEKVSSSSASSSDDEATSKDDVESMISEQMSKESRPATVHFTVASGSVNFNPQVSNTSSRDQRNVSNQLSLEDLSSGHHRQYLSQDDAVQQVPIPTKRSPKQFKRFATTFDLAASQLAPPATQGRPPSLGREPRQRQQLEFRRKLLEFYSAPITAFWSFTISYMVFLSFFTYIVLVRTPIVPEWPEYYVIVYFTTFFADHIRKIILQEPRRLRAKFRVFVSNSWDVCSMTACMTFFLALVLRLDPGTLATGRVLYCINIVFWYLYALKLMSVNSALNPFIHMYGKMVLQLFILSSILFVLLASFGIFRQSVYAPSEDWHWSLLRNIAYKPYSYLYGSLYPEELTECQDEGKNCTPGIWITPLFMTVYLLLAMVVFMNMMVAAFSYIFMEVNARAQEIAKFQAYHQVMEFEQQPFLPPPLTIIAHAYAISKFLYRRFCKKEKNYRFEHSLKLFLAPQEKEKLHEFERDCLNEMLAKKEEKNANTLEGRLKHLSERLDAMSGQVDYIQHQTNTHRLALIKLSSLVLGDYGNNVDSRLSVGNAAQLSPLRSVSDFETESKASEGVRRRFDYSIGSSIRTPKEKRPPASPLSKDPNTKESHSPAFSSFNDTRRNEHGIGSNGNCSGPLSNDEKGMKK